MKQKPAENSAKTAKSKGKPRGKPFQKGQSGNPGGRPKVLAEFKELCQKEGSPKAYRALLESLRPGSKDRARAAEILLAYAWGKPTQAVELTGKDGKPIQTEQHHAVDFSQLNDIQLEQLEALILAATPLPATGEGGEGEAQSKGLPESTA